MIETDKNNLTIYAIKNKTTGKIYIGRTRPEPEKRFTEHITALRCKRHSSKEMQVDFEKYGLKDFEFYVLESNLKYDDREKEQYYMDLYNTQDKKYGYNSKYKKPKIADGIKIIYDFPENKSERKEKVMKKLKMRQDTKFKGGKKGCQKLKLLHHTKQEKYYIEMQNLWEQD